MYWERNLEKHWASNWGTGRVHQFVTLMLGDESVGSRLHVRGKHLVRMAINSHHGDGSSEFVERVPSSLTRKKLIRLLLEKSSPSEESFTQETPRRNDPVYDTMYKNKFEDDMSHRPSICICGPSMISPKGTGKIHIEIDPNLDSNNEIQVTVVPRVHGVEINPLKQHFTWNKRNHSIYFDIESHEDQLHETLEQIFEFWVGPILIGKIKMNMQILPEPHESLDFKNKVHVFEKVIAVYSPDEPMLAPSISRAETMLQGVLHVFHNTFTNATENTSTQFFLSDRAMTCPQFHRACEDTKSVNTTVENSALVYWTHPRPDIKGHPLYSQLPLMSSEPVFFNDWILDSPQALSTHTIKENHQPLIQGSAVTFKSSDGQWLQGKIISSNKDSANILVVGTEELAKNVLRSNIQKAGNPSSGFGTSKRMAGKLAIGDFVFARYMQGHEYFPGVVAGVNWDSNTLDIAFDDGRAEAAVHPKYVKAPFNGGTKEEIAFRSSSTGVFTAGQIVTVVNGRDGSRQVGRVKCAKEFGLKYDVMLNNGEFIQNVMVHEISSTLQTPEEPKRSYVDAMVDRFKETLRRAASESLTSLRTHFNSMDTRKKGELDANDISNALHRLGFTASDTEVLEFIDRVDPKSGTTVNYGAFVKFALPYGVVQYEKKMNKSIAHYESVLNSMGILPLFQNALKTDIGRIWDTFVDEDKLLVSYLNETQLTRCLIHMNVRLNVDQKNHLIRTFLMENSDPTKAKIDYREMATVLELLLVRSLEEKTTEIKYRYNATAPTAINHDRISPKSKSARLKLEMKAVTRIQSVIRMRHARKTVSLRRREQTRNRKETRKFEMNDLKKEAVWWKVGPSQGSRRMFQERLEILDKWKALVALNSNSGVGSLFKAIDTNCDGVLSLQEVSKALSKHGLSTADAGYVMRQMDMDNDGVVDLNDFKLFMSNGTKQFDTKVWYMNKIQMIETIGQDIISKMQKYNKILQDTCDDCLLERLLLRSANLTICSVLRKQGFLLNSAEWRRLETSFATISDRRGDKMVCHDLAAVLNITAAQLKQEKDLEDIQALNSARSSRTIEAVDLRGLDKLCHRISLGVKLAIQNDVRKVWWLCDNDLSMDRIDVELCLVSMEVSYTEMEVEMLFQNIQKDSRVSCKDLARYVSVDDRMLARVNNLHVDNRHSRSTIATQRFKVGERFDDKDMLYKVRSKGIQAMGKWLTSKLGAILINKLRSGFAICLHKGLIVSDASWLSDRMNAKLGYVDAIDCERTLFEFGIKLRSIEFHKLFAVLNSKSIDLLYLADIIAVILRHQAASIKKNVETSHPEEVVSDAEMHIRKALHSFIRQPDGHRTITKVFKSFDIHIDGSLDHEELELALQALNVDITRFNLEPFWKKFDTNSDGKLDYTEFLSALGVRIIKKNTKNVHHFDKLIPRLKDFDKELVDSLSRKLNVPDLCQEDIEDSCYSKNKGLATKQDIIRIFASLDIHQALLSDGELRQMLRFTVAQIHDLLLLALLTQPKSDTRKTEMKCDILYSNLSNLPISGSLLIGTRVTMEGNKSGVVVRIRSPDSFDVRIEDEVLENVHRHQVKVSTAIPVVSKDLVVMNKFTNEQGVVVRYSLGAPGVCDVRMNNKLIQGVPVSTLAPLSSFKKDSSKRNAMIECYHAVDKQFYPGSVVHCFDDGLFAVNFDHGERVSGVPAQAIRPLGAIHLKN